MFVATVDYIPNRRYEVLGLVVGNRSISLLSATEFYKALDKVISEAKSMKTNGVIGIRVFTTPNGSTCVIGTAIRFLE